MNKKIKLHLIVIMAMMISCAKNPSVVIPKTPVQINFTEHDLFPEGMAYDPIHNGFLVSSAAFGSIGFVTFDGTYKSLINDDALTSTTGLKVDKAHQRLWVCNVASGIGAYDLKTGQRIFFTDLSSLLPNAPLFINDETFDADGNVYVTNSAWPVIYKIDLAGNASVFYQNPDYTTAPEDFGFNGIQYNSKGYLLVAHTALNRIIKIPVNNPANYSVVNLNSPLSTPDGILLSKDGKQLVIVSGDKVLSFISNDQWSSGNLSTSFNTGETFPTSLTSDGKRVFVIYCYLDKLLGGEDQDTFTIQEIQLEKPASF